MTGHSWNISDLLIFKIMLKDGGKVEVPRMHLKVSSFICLARYSVCSWGGGGGSETG